METNASRTLVKSAPELWELADDEARMALWLAQLTGATGPVEVAVTAHHHSEVARAAAALENLLYDLGSPEQQPFAPA